MTLQVEFWTVVGFLITFMSFVGGIAKWLFSKAEERQAARFASLEQSLQQSASNWGELEKEFMRFKADLPLNYVRREDYIRGQTVIEAKLDALYNKLELVSTIDQNSDLQRNALTSANCDRIFEDRMSGKVASRPGLKRALKCVNSGDTLVVWKLDRLGRSVKNLIALISELHERGAHFRSLTDSIDTSTAMGRFFFHVMSALAEMERELIVERTLAGLAAARAQGRVGGRPNALKAHEREQIGRLLAKGHTRQQLAIIYGVGLSTLYRYFPVDGQRKDDAIGL